MAEKQATFIGADDVTDVFTVDNAFVSPVQKTDAENRTDALAEALSDDPDAFINVSRQLSGGNSPMEFVGRYPADKYDFGQLQAHLQREYGGGDYRLMLYAKGKLRANKLITIATKIASATGPQTSTGGEVSQILATIMTTMRDQNERMISLMASQKTDEMEMLNKIQLYRSIFSDGNSGGGNALSQISETVALLGSLGIEVGAGQKEEGNAFTALIEKAAPLFVSAAQQQPQYKPNPSPRGEKPMFGNMTLKMGISQLLKAAAKNGDASLYAEMVLDQLSPETVKNFITSPDALDKMRQLDARVGEYLPWFTDLAEHIKAMLGMPSKYAHLYGEDESVINPESNTFDSENDAGSVPTS